MNLDELLKRLADARDLNVPERERENLCSLAHGAITKLRSALLDSINELEHSGYYFDHPSLVEKRKLIEA